MKFIKERNLPLGPLRQEILIPPTPEKGRETRLELLKSREPPVGRRDVQKTRDERDGLLRFGHQLFVAQEQRVGTRPGLPGEIMIAPTAKLTRARDYVRQ